MSGASRAPTSAAASPPCASPLAISVESTPRPRLKTGTEASYMESGMVMSLLDGEER